MRKKEGEKTLPFSPTELDGKFPFDCKSCSDRGVSGKEFTKSSSEEAVTGAGNWRAGAIVGGWLANWKASASTLDSSLPTAQPQALSGGPVSSYPGVHQDFQGRARSNWHPWGSFDKERKPPHPSPLRSCMGVQKVANHLPPEAPVLRLPDL